MHTDGSLRYRGWVMILQSEVLREEIFREFHCSRFTVYPGDMKMYHDLSPVLLEWDEETCWRFRSTMSHVSTGKG